MIRRSSPSRTPRRAPPRAHWAGHPRPAPVRPEVLPPGALPPPPRPGEEEEPPPADDDATEGDAPPAAKTPAQWTASLPSPCTVDQALALIKAALQDAEDRIMFYKGMGTVPPPPWPVHPELKKAIDSLDGGRLQLEMAVALGKSDLSAKKGEPRWEQLRIGGENLYRELAVLDANMAKGVDVTKLISAGAKAASFVISPLGQLPAWVLLLGLWWFFGRKRG